MARKRMIDPEFWNDEEIGTTWSHSARLFYIGLWNFADDEGRFKAHNSLLKSQIFPYDAEIDVEKLKHELGNKVQWYEVEGSQYGYIRNFHKHQRIDRPTPSKLPKPPRVIAEGSSSPQRGLVPNIIEDKLSKDNKSQPSAALRAALDKVSNDGFNVYALLTKTKTQLKQAPTFEFPEEVLLKVCEAYWREKKDILHAWPWFRKVLADEWYRYNVDKNMTEGKTYTALSGEGSGVPIPLAEILREMAKRETLI